MECISLRVRATGGVGRRHYYRGFSACMLSFSEDAKDLTCHFDDISIPVSSRTYFLLTKQDCLLSERNLDAEGISWRRCRLHPNEDPA